MTAGGSVGVRAEEQIDFFGFVGSFQGGFVAVGASVLVVNVDSNTDASIGSGALVQAGTGSGDCTTVGYCVTVAAAYDEHVQGIGIAGQRRVRRGRRAGRRDLHGRPDRAHRLRRRAPAGRWRHQVPQARTATSRRCR